MNKSIIDEPQSRAADHTAARRGERGARKDGDAGNRRRIPLDRLREVGRNLGTQFDEQVHKRPYAVLGAVLGAGFVAGSVFGSRLGQVLFAAGVGYVAKHYLGGDFGIDRIQASLERLATEAERSATPS